MWAFDLIELNGDDLRREPLNVRKAPLAAKEPAKPPIIGQRAGDLRT
jgi:ATP-dependent DNA ligase